MHYQGLATNQTPVTKANTGLSMLVDGEGWCDLSTVKTHEIIVPGCSMYGTFTHIWAIVWVNVGKYSSTMEHFGYGFAGNLHIEWKKKSMVSWFPILVGGLEHQFDFPIYWVANHPNWLSYSSEGWLNHQPVAYRRRTPMCRFGPCHGTLVFAKAHDVASPGDQWGGNDRRGRDRDGLAGPEKKRR